MADAHRAEIAKLESLYAEHPEGRVFTHLAEAYRKAGELDRAQEVLREGIERHPDYPSAHVVLGRVLMDRGETERAESEFRRVLDLDAQNLVALRALGDLARAEGRPGDALTFYERLLDVEPADDSVRDLVATLSADEAPAASGAAPGLDETLTTAPAAGETGPFGTPVGFEPTAETAPPAPEEAGPEPAADQEPAFEQPSEQPLEQPSEQPSEQPWETQAEGGEPEAEPEWSTTEWSGVEGGSWEPSGAGDVGDEDDFSPEDFSIPDFSAIEPAGIDREEGEEADEATGEPAGEATGEAAREEWEPADEEADRTGSGMDLYAAGFGIGGAAEPGDTAGEPVPGEPTRDEPSAGEGVRPDDEERDLTTETIAGIYARQGLYDRAADVYRQLLERRPGDEALRARLEEMEGLAGAAQPERGPAAGSPPEPEPAEPASPGPAPPEPWTPAGESERAGETAPEGFMASEFEAADPDVAPLDGLETEASLEPEAADASGPAGDEPGTTAGPAAPPGWLDEAVRQEEPGPDPDREPMAGLEPEPEPEPEPETVEAMWTGADGVATHDESPYAWTDGEAPPDDSEPIGSYFRSLLAWSGGGAAADPAGAPDVAEPTELAGPTEPEPAEPTEPEQQAPAAGAEAAPAPDEAAAGEGGPGDDDDLDTFRSWLESLKQ